MPAYVGNCLSEAEIRTAGYFDSGAVEKLVAKSRRQALTGFRDNAALIGVLSTQLWHQEFVRGTQAAAPVTSLAQVG